MRTLALRMAMGARHYPIRSPRLFQRPLHNLSELPHPTSTEVEQAPRLTPCPTPSSSSSTSAAAAIPPTGPDAHHPDAAESSRMAIQRQKSSSMHLSSWSAPPKGILIVQKPEDPRTNEAVVRIVEYFTTHHPSIPLLLEPHSLPPLPKSLASHPSIINVEPTAQALLPLHTSLVITVGGDGTILHTSNLFSQGACPPVLSFSLGSLGFLLPFHIDQMAETIEQALTGPVKVLDRMRLSCSITDQHGQPRRVKESNGNMSWQVMNEITLHRGREPHLTVVDAYFDNQHLTEAVADGLLVSTPTGSTAYSLSAGGPISHPETDAFLLTPIAPRSLSFRTVVLPSRGEVRLTVSPLTRSPTEMSTDGRFLTLMGAHESVLITRSPYPIPCIERGDASGWARDINSLLQFNVGFKNKSMLGHNSG